MSLKLYRRPGSKVWYLRGTVQESYVYESTGTGDKTEAEVLRAKRATELFKGYVLGESAVVAFTDGAARYLSFEERSPATKDYVIRLLNHFGEDTLLRDALKQTAADAAVTALVGDAAAPATKIRTVYTPLTAIGTFCHARGLCEVPKFDRPSVAKSVPNWMTPDQALTLIESAAPHLRPMALFMFGSGPRLSEVLGLDWPDVDLSAARAVLRDTKNGRDRIALLTPNTVMAMANLAHRTGKVFRRDDGKPYELKDEDGWHTEGGQIKNAWAGACGRGGLSQWRKVNPAKGGKPTGASASQEAEYERTRVRYAPLFTPHDARHSWATWFYALKPDLLLLKDEGGWESTKMVEVYAHLMSPSLVPDIVKVWGGPHPRIGGFAAPMAAVIDGARRA